MLLFFDFDLVRIQSQKLFHVEQFCIKMPLDLGNHENIKGYLIEISFILRRFYNFTFQIVPRGTIYLNSTE